MKRPKVKFKNAELGHKNFPQNKSSIRKKVIKQQ